MMAAEAALASLLALLAANGTSPLDCLCRSIHNRTDAGRTISDNTVSAGEGWMWNGYCSFLGNYELVERCETLEAPSAAAPAVARLVPHDWYGAPPPPEEAGDCGAALADIRGLADDDARELVCSVAEHCTDFCSAQRLNDTKWTAETLAADNQNISQLLHTAGCIARAMQMMQTCVEWGVVVTGRGAMKGGSSQWWRATRLLPHIVTLVSQLFIPLAFEHIGNHKNGEQLRGWVKNMERVKDKLDTKLWSIVHDAQFLSEQIANYKLEEDKNRPGKYIIRRPLLNEDLLVYREDLLSFRPDFGELCEQQLPNAPAVFGLADALYSFYRYYLTPSWRIVNSDVKLKDEGWQLEDQSETEVSVDTGCLQLLADAVARPRCPLEELPPAAIEQRKRCREQLWRDLVERPPPLPVTSYLAYTQRTGVSLCLLAWMAANSYGICQDVPFSLVQSVHDARCYFESPNNQTCLQSNTTNAICSFSRGILLFKCREFSSVNTPSLCSVSLYGNGQYSETQNGTWRKRHYKLYGRPTARALRAQENLNRATLKYKDINPPSNEIFLLH